MHHRSNPPYRILRFATLVTALLLAACSSERYTPPPLAFAGDSTITSFAISSFLLYLQRAPKGMHGHSLILLYHSCCVLCQQKLYYRST